MKLNQDKCHFLISGNVTEHLRAKVGDEMGECLRKTTWSHY